MSMGTILGIFFGVILVILSIMALVDYLIKKRTKSNPGLDSNNPKDSNDPENPNDQQNDEPKSPSTEIDENQTLLQKNQNKQNASDGKK